MTVLERCQILSWQCWSQFFSVEVLHRRISGSDRKTFARFLYIQVFSNLLDINLLLCLRLYSNGSNQKWTLRLVAIWAKLGCNLLRPSKQYILSLANFITLLIRQDGLLKLYNYYSDSEVPNTPKSTKDKDAHTFKR